MDFDEVIVNDIEELPMHRDAKADSMGFKNTTEKNKH